MAIHSSGQIIFRFTYIEGIILDAGEEVDEIAGRFLAKVGARNGM